MSEAPEKDRRQIDYFAWVQEQLGFTGMVGRTYSYLIKKLHDTEFSSPIARDSNRVDDARNARKEYAEERNIPWQQLEWLEGPVSCLEIIWGLSRRIQDQLWNTDYFTRPLASFASEILENLGLAGYTDQYLYGDQDAADKIEEVDEIIHCWLERKKFHGDYVFAFDHMVSDDVMIGLELWNQMQQHMLVRYPIG